MSTPSSSAQQHWMGLESGLCAGHPNSSTLKDLAFSPEYSHAVTGKGLPQTVATKLEAHSVQISLYDDFSYRN